MSGIDVVNGVEFVYMLRVCRVQMFFENISEVCHIRMLQEC